VKRDSDTFPALVADFDGERVGTVGSAESRLMRQRAIVDFGVDRFRAESSQIATGRPNGLSKSVSPSS
jgi:aminoglycoside N3'-acetyltransferase